MNKSNRIPTVLLLLRVSVFVVMLVWTIDKFVRSEHAISIFEHFYLSKVWAPPWSLDPKENSRCSFAEPKDVYRFLVTHQFGHSLRVRRSHMGIGVQDQFPAIAMPLPLRNYLYVNTLLDRPCDKHPSK